MYQINWVHFTLDQRKLIEKIIAQGEYKKITKLIVVENQEQENEITKFIESASPQGSNFESQVREQIKLLRRKGEEILTPEEEAEWQRKLDEEANPTRTAIAEETAKLKSELTALEINFPAGASYEQLKALKAEAEAPKDPADDADNSAEEEKPEEDEATEEKKADEEKPEEEKPEQEGTPHVVTAEDLEASPELKDEGVKVGDTIYLPDVDAEDEEESKEEEEEETDEKKESKEKKVGSSKAKKTKSSNKK